MPTLKKLEDTAARRLDLLLVKYEREAAAILQDALSDVRNTLTKIYDKYAVNGVLTKAQMTQYNRLTNLEAEIVQNIKPAVNKVAALSKRIPPEIYQQSFFQHAWAVDASQGIRLKWGTLNLDAVLKNTDNPMDKITISKNLESQIGELAAQMMRDDAIAGAKIALNKGLPLGKSYASMASDLKESINTTAYRALRIIRTEGQTAMNAGQDAAYYRAEEAGVEGEYIWDATLDGKTRPEHAAMDQKARNEETGVFNGPGSEIARYPADTNLSAGNRIHCRCRLRFEVTGFSPLLRRTRDQGLVPYQDYKTWKGQQATVTATKNISTVSKNVSVATTSKGAEEWAIKNIEGLREVSYQGIAANYANQINNGIYTMQVKHGNLNLFRIRPSDKPRALMSTPNSVSQEWVIDSKGFKMPGKLHHGSDLELSTTYLSDKSDNVQDLIMQHYNAGFSVGRSLNEDVIHEMGHSLVFRNISSADLKRGVAKEITDLKNMGAGISEYANQDGFELISEAVTLLETGRGKMVSDTVRGIVKQYTGVKYD